MKVNKYTALKREQRIACEGYFQEYCKRKGYHPGHVVHLGRRRDLVEMKRDVAKYLRSLGYSYPVIGLVMDKHHTTIMHMVNDDFRERSNEKSRAYHKNNVAINTK